MVATALRRIAGKTTGPTPARVETEIEGAVDYAAWITEGVLIATGWIQIESGTSLSANAIIDGGTLPLRVSYTSYSRPDVSAPQGGKVLMIQRLNAEMLGEPKGILLLNADGGRLLIEFSTLRKKMTDLSTALASGLGWLDIKTRTGILEFIGSVLTDGRQNSDSLPLNKSLLTARDALHVELKLEGRLPALHIEALMAVDEKSYYLRGWMHDTESKITHLTLISPDGQRIELYDSLIRHRRNDIENVYGGSLNVRPVGFAGCFEMAETSRLSSGWKVEMRNAAGEVTQVPAPSLVRDLVSVRDTVLQDLALEPNRSDALIRNYIFPVITKLQERHGKMTVAETVYDFGKREQSPEVSIIIPLYRRIDFLEHQMAQFCHDPEIDKHDIIYVLDSPELAQELADLALQLFQLYRIPFRVVVLNQNAGFSGVNNVGGSLAHGRLLLLLNSDVLPDKPGWLGNMKAFYDSTPKIGALGTKIAIRGRIPSARGSVFFSLNRIFGMG